MTSPIVCCSARQIRNNYFIYETFAEIKYTKKEAFKRKSKLALELPLHQALTLDEIILLTPKIASKYAKLNKATLSRDLKELQDLNLIRKDGRKFIANTIILKEMMPGRKS